MNRGIQRDILSRRWEVIHILTVIPMEKCILTNKKRHMIWR